MNHHERQSVLNKNCDANFLTINPDRRDIFPQEKNEEILWDDLNEGYGQKDFNNAREDLRRMGEKTLQSCIGLKCKIGEEIFVIKQHDDGEPFFAFPGE